MLACWGWDAELIIGPLFVPGVGIPLKLLHEAEGHIVTCELNTGEMYRGRLTRLVRFGTGDIEVMLAAFPSATSMVLDRRICTHVYMRRL